MIWVDAEDTKVLKFQISHKHGDRGRSWKMQSLHLHNQRCYIFGIVVKEGEIVETDQL